MVELFKELDEDENLNISKPEMEGQSKKRKLSTQEMSEAAKNGDVERLTELINSDAHAVNTEDQVIMRIVLKTHLGQVIVTC